MREPGRINKYLRSANFLILIDTEIVYFQLVITFKTARALRLIVPIMLLGRADEVIE